MKKKLIKFINKLVFGENDGAQEGRPSLDEIQAPHNLYRYEMLSSYIKIMHAICS
ncbi:MAG: hypothetical protein WCS73_01400 [Lentisphaeria bacterium]